MVMNLQFFGGRGAGSGISASGKIYGSQYKTLLEYENIKFVTNVEKNYESLMETMTKGRTQQRNHTKRYQPLMQVKNILTWL